MVDVNFHSQITHNTRIPFKSRIGDSKGHSSPDHSGDAPQCASRNIERVKPFREQLACTTYARRTPAKTTLPDELQIYHSVENRAVGGIHHDSDAVDDGRAKIIEPVAAYADTD